MRSAILSAARPAVSAPRAVASASSRSITIPAPETVAKEGETNTFVVRTDNVIDNSATALRLLRAVEKELGPVTRVDVPKDQDLRRGFKFMSVQTLRPRALPESEAITGELPAGRIDAGADTGGVSLGDVLAALNGGDPPAASTKKTQRLVYRVHARDRPLRSMNQGRRDAKPTLSERKEDSAIVTALRALGGGFEGIAERFAELELAPEPAPPTHTRPKSMKPAANAAPAAPAAAAEVAAPAPAPARAADAADAAPEPEPEELPKETGPRKSFAQIVAEQRAAKEAAMTQQPTPAAPEVRAQGPSAEAKQEEKAAAAADAADARRSKLEQRAIERARKAAIAQQEAERRAAEEAAAAAKAAEEARIAAEKAAEPPKKKGWF